MTVIVERRASAAAPRVLALSAGRAVVVLFILGLASSCNGTTGYDLVDFYAAAAGPTSAVSGQPYAFTNDHGFAVTLDRAVIHIGAIYLDESVPTSGQQQEPCVLPGTYVGEVRGGGDFDMLSPSPQLFPVAGDGSTIPAATAEVWLSHGDVFASADPLPVLTLDGVATKGGSAPIHFQAGITIDGNRSPAPSNTALPGENPICLERIVTPILVDITLAQAGTLVLDLDPSSLFVNVDFSAFLSCPSCQVTADDGSITYLFTNDTTNQPSINLYKNLTAAGPVYRFEWQPSAP
jgi:hypothetical protein